MLKSMSEVFLKPGPSGVLFYDVLQPEVVKDNSDPAQCKDEDDEENLGDKSAFLLEDVKDTPDSGDNAKDVDDNSCNHNMRFVYLTSRIY